MSALRVEVSYQTWDRKYKASNGILYEEEARANLEGLARTKRRRESGRIYGPGHIFDSA
jgi:hypothetical protein